MATSRRLALVSTVVLAPVAPLPEEAVIRHRCEANAQSDDLPKPQTDDARARDRPPPQRKKRNCPSDKNIMR